MMHIEYNYIQSNYNMFIGQLSTTEQQRDLGISTKDLKWQKKERKAENGQQCTGVYCPQFRYKNKKLILPFYKSIVRPHLEHAVQFWSPHLSQDIDKIENLQRRATQMIPEIRTDSYHHRIQDIDLISLVQRRLRGQLIEVFKYLN